MNKLFYFGEKVDGYDIRVLNEREARAAAGILFMFGMVSFFNSYLLHDFRFTKIFVTVFMVDFFIRIFLNPKFAPSMILARVFIAHQTPEYVGAPQKRWAWGIGFTLAVIMFMLIVVFEVMTPIKIVICLLCLLFLFSESAFGICLGCKMYHLIYHKNAQYCPGDVCEVRQKEEIQKISAVQAVILVLALVVISGVTYNLIFAEDVSTSSKGMKCQAGKCMVGKCGG